MDIAAVSQTFARSAQSHARTVQAGRASAEQAISQAGQKEFERSQISVGAKLGKMVDVLA